MKWIKTYNKLFESESEDFDIEEIKPEPLFDVEMVRLRLIIRKRR